MVDRLGSSNKGEQTKRFVELTSLIGSSVVDSVDMTSEDVRVSYYKSLLNNMSGTVMISPNNFSQVFDEFVRYCKDLRPYADIVHINLDGLISQEAIMTHISSVLGLEGDHTNIDDVSVLLAKKFTKNFKSGIYIFTGTPCFSHEEDYLYDIFPNPKVSATDEKVFYLGTDLGEVEYWSEHLGLKKPIFLK